MNVEDINAAHGRAYEFFLAQHIDWWQNEAIIKWKDLDQVALQVAEMGALLRLAAVIAVDAGMAVEAFLASTQESYADADRAAPRWG